MITRLRAVDGIMLDFDSSVPCLVATHVGFVTSEEFRNHCEFSLQAISQKVAEHGKVAWVTDLRKAEIFSDDDVKWINEYWNLQAYAKGLQYSAMIKAKNTFAAINLEDMVKEHNRRKDLMVFRLFSDMDSATEWCKEMLAQ
jgi:hypothetical protein